MLLVTASTTTLNQLWKPQRIPNRCFRSLTSIHLTLVSAHRTPMDSTFFSGITMPCWPIKYGPTSLILPWISVVVLSTFTSLISALARCAFRPSRTRTLLFTICVLSRTRPGSPFRIVLSVSYDIFSASTPWIASGTSQDHHLARTIPLHNVTPDVRAGPNLFLLITLYILSGGVRDPFSHFPFPLPVPARMFQKIKSLKSGGTVGG